MDSAEQRRRQRSGPRRGWRIAVGLSVGWLVLWTGGCASLARRSPADEAVAARRLSLMAVDAHRAGQWDEANQLFQQAVRSCPADEQSRRRYADALWQQQRREEALAQMVEVVRLSADEPEVLVQFGQMLLVQGELARADEVSRRALRVNPHLAEALALRGDVLRAEGQLDEALEHYLRALGQRAHYPQVQLAVAEVHQQRGRPLRCLSTLASLAQHYPAGQEPLEATMMEGIVLKELGRYSEAVERLAAAEQRGVRTPALLYHLGEARLLAGDPVNARLAAHAALELRPHDPAARQLLARISDVESRMSLMVR